MHLLGLVCNFIGIIFYVLVMSYCYKTITIKYNYSKKRLLCLVLIFSIIIFIVNYFIPLKYRVVCFVLIMLTFYKILFNQNIKYLLLKTFVIYFSLLIVDFIVSLGTMFIPNIKSIGIEYLNFVKCACTILDSLFLLLLFKIPIFVKFVKKILQFLLIKFDYIKIIFLILGFSSFLLITYKNAHNLNLDTFITCFVLLSFFFALCGIVTYQFFRNKSKEEEQKQLLNLMEEYEEVLEKDRENRHEILNNLVILRMEKNKNSKKYNELLDDIINQYQNKKTQNYTSLYKLPSGIKGIVYYKMANMKDNDINFTSVVSNEMYEIFDNMNSKLYYKVCKILGILIDNAIEAATKSKEKHILIDIYKEFDELHIYLENSYEGTIDLDSINKKGYSTKGKNRGLGLNIVHKLLNETDDVILEQKLISNMFTTEIKIINNENKKK